MFSIRPSEPADCEAIYHRSTELFAEHVDQNESARMSLDEFKAIHAERFVKFRVLTTGADVLEEADSDCCYSDLSADTGRRHRLPEYRDERIVGYIAFMNDYDISFGGPGILVDQLYICDRFRGKGHGRRLINCVQTEAIRKSAKYIKLFYQQNGEREAIYNRLGFESVTRDPPYIRLFEIYGAEEIRNRLNLNVYERVEEGIRTLPVKPGIEVVQYQQAHDSSTGYGSLILSFSLTSEYDYPKFPSTRLILVVKHSVRIHSLPGLFEINSLKRFLSQRGISIDVPPLNLWNQISRQESTANEVITEPDVRICAFVERPTVCCWLGHQLTFNNFVGDLELVTKELLIQRVRAWSAKWGPILGLNFEISGCQETQGLSTSSTLVRMLNSLGIHGDPRTNCAVMVGDNIREITAD